MQNPFTTTFSKAPEYTYIASEDLVKIVDNYSYDFPSESVYKITGVIGSGKTVLLAKLEEVFRSEDMKSHGWIVIDVSSARDMLFQIAARLHKEGYGKKDIIKTGFNVSATLLGTGAGVGISRDIENSYFDIGIEIESMLEDVKKAGKKNSYRCR